MSIRQQHVELIYEAVGANEADVRQFIEGIKDGELRAALRHVLKASPGRLFAKLEHLKKLDGESTGVPTEAVATLTEPPAGAVD